jgi:RNA polymerase sigma-70 factor (ECF subfamily)
MLVPVNVRPRYEPAPRAHPADRGPAGAEHDADADADDAEVIGLSRDDPEQFATIFDRHADEIHRYAARRLGQQAAADVVSDVFLAAFRNRGRYDAVRADARPWLYGIATKVISQHVRAEGRRARTLAALPVPLPAVFSVEEISDRITAAQVPAAQRVASERNGRLRDHLRHRECELGAGRAGPEPELRADVPRRGTCAGHRPDSARRQRGWQAWHRRRRVHSARTREGAG